MNVSYSISILKFVNWQAQGIKEANPTNLVTVGSWNAKAQSDAFSDTSKRLIHYITI